MIYHFESGLLQDLDVSKKELEIFKQEWLMGIMTAQSDTDEDGMFREVYQK